MSLWRPRKHTLIDFTMGKHTSDKIHAPELFHFRGNRMHDSIWVQQRHNYVNDDEEHEQHPHLQDFLRPNHLAHIERLEDEEMEKLIEKREDSDVPLVIVRAKKPTLARPCPSILHKVDCEGRQECKITQAKQQHVSFGQITVRNYDMILGDHPNCSRGPPVTLDWDYLEYEPLPVNEYEIHHARRRPLRLMHLKSDRRRELLKMAGYSNGSIQVATRNVEKIKRQRAITKKCLPARSAEEAMATARRNLMRAFKKRE